MTDNLCYQYLPKHLSCSVLLKQTQYIQYLVTSWIINVLLIWTTFYQDVSSTDNTSKEFTVTQQDNTMTQNDHDVPRNNFKVGTLNL